MLWLDFLTFFSRFSNEKTGEISHFSLTPVGGENEKNSLTTRNKALYDAHTRTVTENGARAGPYWVSRRRRVIATVGFF
jgi:hypothetical protein